MVLVVSLQQIFSQGLIWVGLGLLLLLYDSNGVISYRIDDIPNGYIVVLQQLRVQHPHEVVRLLLSLLLPINDLMWTFGLD
jgi:hypothetical protein